MRKRNPGTFVVLDHADVDRAGQAGGTEAIAVFYAYVRACGADNAIGPCDRSDAEMARRAFVSERTLREHRRRLVDAGLLTLERFPGATTRVTLTPAGDAGVRLVTPAGDAAPPAGDAAHPGSSCRTPRQELPGSLCKQENAENEEGREAIAQLTFDELAPMRATARPGFLEARLELEQRAATR